MVRWPTDPAHALMVAVSVLIVTCPTTLSLATPVRCVSAAEDAGHATACWWHNLQGLEALAEVDTVVSTKPVL